MGPMDKSQKLFANSYSADRDELGSPSTESRDSSPVFSDSQRGSHFIWVSLASRPRCLFWKTQRGNSWLSTGNTSWQLRCGHCTHLGKWRRRYTTIKDIFPDCTFQMKPIILSVPPSWMEMTEARVKLMNSHGLEEKQGGTVPFLKLAMACAGGPACMASSPPHSNSDWCLLQTGSVSGPLCGFTHLIVSTVHSLSGSICTPVLEMRKPRHSSIKLPEAQY